MYLVLKVFVLWVSIGILVNIIVNKRIPILSQYSEEEIEDLIFDIKWGPIVPIYYFIILIEDRFKNEDD